MQLYNLETGIGKTEPDHFYRVSDLLPLFRAEPGKKESFAHDEAFKGKDSALSIAFSLVELL